MSAIAIRQRLLQIITDNPGGHHDPSIREAFSSTLREYADASDSDPNDIIYAIGSSVFGVVVDSSSTPPTKKAKNGSSTDEDEEEVLPIVSFDYMKEFITQVFLSYGVTPARAELCADVLIESDKRGIDSHGLGRLKPIYCDRMDKGILYPEKPIDIVAECEACALVDGHLGLGLYIGPHCMQMAIDRAKKYGVGFVAVKNSTVREEEKIMTSIGFAFTFIFSSRNDASDITDSYLITHLSFNSTMVLQGIMQLWPPTKDGTHDDHPIPFHIFSWPPPQLKYFDVTSLRVPLSVLD